jgi:hypothetical protein
LREARERRGISLRQISSITKISTTALEALERNDLSRLPGGIFSRAFVRSYAVQVGLDPEEAIQAFLAQFPHNAVARAASIDSGDDGGVHESNQRMATAFVRLIAISVPLVAAVLYFTAPTPGGTEPAGEPPGDSLRREEPMPTIAPALESGGQAPPERVLSLEPAQRFAPPAPSPSADRASLIVELEALGPCWLSLVVDGRAMPERELIAGERQRLEVDRDVLLTAGDAAALRLVLNGNEARPLGRPGQVITIRMTPANFQRFLPTP